MPTPLGALPNNEVLPNIRSAINRGAYYGAYSYDNNTPAGTPIGDGIGSGYTITRICKYSCYLIAELQIAMCGPREAWDYGMFGVRITPADIDGISLGNYAIAPLNSAIGWRTYHCTYPFRCGVGTYTIQATWEGNQGGAATSYYVHPNYTFLTVEQVGEAVV